MLTSPVWHLVPGVFQATSGQAVVGTEMADEFPEMTRMIHLAHVAEFVNQNVSDQVRFHEQQFLIETDRPGRRTASPTAFLAANGRLDECDPRLGT